MSARNAALNALIACRRQDGWPSGILKDEIRRENLDRRDAALASRLCYGVLQNRSLLDFYLSQLLTGKIKSLHPVARDILHMGVYQILFMDRVPDSAAVNESVDLARKYCRKQRNVPGLVNAVLRNAVRSKGSFKQPKDIAVTYSHPQALVELFRENVPEDWLIPMLEANNSAPDTVIQVNTLRVGMDALAAELEEEGIQVSVHPWMGDCLVLRGTGDVSRLKSFREGKFYVQDAAAKLSVLCAGIPSGKEIRVLDCCAAPGGKSFAAAISMGGQGSICACDVYPHKIPLIEAGARRLGFDTITALVQDASEEKPEWRETMDVVLADVPCSGYGIIRKKPDIREKDPREMEQLPALQLKILLQQAKYIKPGGTLLYSTCTILRRENEDVVAAFLKCREDFMLEKLTLPEVFPGNESGMLTLLPGQYDTDGFFICRMRRKA